MLVAATSGSYHTSSRFIHHEIPNLKRRCSTPNLIRTMNRSQWSPHPSRPDSMVDSPLNQHSKWAYGVGNRPENSDANSWYFPLPQENVPRTQAPIHRSSATTSDPVYADSGVFDSMHPGMASFPYLMSEQSPTPPMSDQSSPFLEFKPNMTAQQNYAMSQHHSRENTGFEFEQPATTFNQHASHNPYHSSTASMSGHGSEEEGGTSKEQEERLLLQLKDEQNQSWKKIAEIFKTQCGKDYSVPALQMRYRRLRQRRLLDFNDADQAALVAAYDYWETKRWEIISEKMAEFGATDSWTPKACSAAWLRLKNREDVSKARPQAGEQNPDIWRPVDVPGSIQKSS